MDYIARFETLSMHDVDKVGGKNSSLGEMIHNLTDKGVRVPGGFATTADAFREYLANNGLADRIVAKLQTLMLGDNRRHINLAMDDLGYETQEFAHRRMDQNVKRALAGRSVDELSNPQPAGEHA